MIIDLVKQFKNYYHNSFFVKNIKTTGSKITSAWNDSIIGSFFIIDTSDEAAAKSSLLNALATPFLALRAASNKTSDFIRQSAVTAEHFIWQRCTFIIR